MIVGLVCYKKELGASIGYIKALFSLKKIYQCKLIVFGNSMTHNLFRYCEYIDESLDLGDLENGMMQNQKLQLEIINQYHCDYLIASTAIKTHIRFLLSSNARYIICATKLLTLLSYRCKTVPIYFFNKYRNMRHEDIMLHFVRRIKPKVFDVHIASLDFKDSMLHVGETYKTRAQEFLLQSLESVRIHLAKSPKHSQNRDTTVLTNSHLPHLKSMQTINPYLIMINPFNVNNLFSLTMPYWLKLMEKITQIPQCIPLVVTYPQVHKDFMEKINHYEGNLSSLIVFANNDDILNLVAIIKEMSCLISPSTGSIHVASNLHIPTLGLYAEWDTGRWGTRDNRYVFIPDIKDKLDSYTQEKIITQVLDILKSMIESKAIDSIKIID
ncbi:hypothetical protein CQA44_08690 [Helicobacter sp. MIT 14-3879]|nr:hypothetical protein CQA44_08690 [Helicobacter sp. MIT 14-3879]